MNNRTPPSSDLQTILRKAQTSFINQQYSDAANYFTRALEHAPNNPDLLFSAGNAFRHIENFASAAEMYQQAISKRPDFFAAHCNLGAALQQLHHYSEAIIHIEKAVQLQPEIAQLHLQLADLYSRQSNRDRAYEVLLTALERWPESPEILNGLGNLSFEKHQLNKAKEYYVKALQIRPDYADAHYNLGNILREWKHLDEAVTCYRNAIRFRPDAVLPLVNLGEALQLLGETDESESCFRKALAIDPKCRLAHHNLLVSMNYNYRYTRQEVTDAHNRWGEQFALKVPHHTWLNDPAPDRPLRIGYLSPDFCNHPAAAFLEPILRHHNRDLFEVYCYAQTVHHDDRSERFKRYAHQWHAIERLDDNEVVELIRNDAIDILIDTAGHLNGNRLGVFAQRAAPVQISGIGYPCVTGLNVIDYRITDSVIDPQEVQSGVTEQPLRIKNCFCCYQPPDVLPPLTGLPVQSNGYITFGSLHTTARLNEKTIALWSSVLRALPSSRLIICRTTLTPSVTARLTTLFTRNDVDPARLTFMQTIAKDGHLTVYNRIDLTLDTLPWSGHTTACESLIMGVPVITLKGDRPAGRMVASILTAVGLPEYIASSEKQYAGIAEKATASINDLSLLHSELRSRVLSSHLCDAPLYMQNIEQQYRAVWTAWCTGSDER